MSFGTSQWRDWICSLFGRVLCVINFWLTCICITGQCDWWWDFLGYFQLGTCLKVSLFIIYFFVWKSRGISIPTILYKKVNDKALTHRSPQPLAKCCWERALWTWGQGTLPGSSSMLMACGLLWFRRGEETRPLSFLACQAGCSHKGPAQLFKGVLYTFFIFSMEFPLTFISDLKG